MANGKVLRHILGSEVWKEEDHVRLVWVALLGLRDREHLVHRSVEKIADVAYVTSEETERALERLVNLGYIKDVSVEDGECWEVVRGENYMEGMSLEELREYNRIKQKEYRQRVKFYEARGEKAPSRRKRGKKKVRKKTKRSFIPELELFRDIYEEVRGRAYIISNIGEDCAHAKWMLKACGEDMEKLRKIYHTYLNCNVKFYADNGYSLKILRVSFNGIYDRAFSNPIDINI